MFQYCSIALYTENGSKRKSVYNIKEKDKPTMYTNACMDVCMYVYTCTCMHGNDLDFIIHVP